MIRSLFIAAISLITLSVLISTYSSDVEFSLQDSLAQAVTFSDISQPVSTESSLTQQQQATSLALDYLKSTDSDTITIGWVGDIVPGDLISGDKLFTHVTKSLQKPDIMLGNLEGALFDGEVTDPKCNKDSANCFLFIGPESFANSLAKVGFDGVLLGNNHTIDAGQAGLTATTAALAKENIKSFGVYNQDFPIFTVKNQRVAVLGFSPFRGSNLFLSPAVVTERINQAKQSADHVVVTFHAGAEDGSIITPDTTEYYLGENRGNLREFARIAIAAGADVVLGSGPHVLREIETTDTTLVAYSLGNFADASGKLNTRGNLGVSAILTISLNPNDSIDYSLQPIRIEGGVPA